MVKVKKISKYEVPKLVELAYDGDIDLLEKYHVATYKLDEAVASTVEMIDQQSKDTDLNYYKVVYQKKPIGYFITGFQNLFSFGINKKYRNREVLTQWWKAIKQELGSTFDCNLYANNEPAIRFLQKNGMKIAGYFKEQNIIKLINS